VATSTVTSGDHFTYAAAAPVTTTTTTGTSTTTTTTVPVVPAAGVGPTPAPPTPASAPTSGLALTGIDLSLMLFGGAGLIGLGAFFVLSSRRVRRGQPGRHVRGG
jgi:hypothetical protein